MADLVNRSNEGRLDTLTGKDVLMGLAGVSMRAGAGMFLMDKFLDGLVNSVQSPEQGEELLSVLGRGAAAYTGSAWSGLFVPFQQLKDISAHFSESEATLRDTSGDPLAGATKRRIPFAAGNMPEVESMTEAAPPRNLYPLTRQATGLTWKAAKNPAKQEFDRLGFTQSDIYQSSGDDQWDRAMKHEIGPLVEDQISRLVSSPGYAGIEDRVLRKGVLKKAMAKLREQARVKAAVKNPEAFARSREQRQSEPVRRLRALSRDARAQQRQDRMRRLEADRG